MQILRLTKQSFRHPIVNAGSDLTEKIIFPFLILPIDHIEAFQQLVHEDKGLIHRSLPIVINGYHIISRTDSVPRHQGGMLPEVAKQPDRFDSLIILTQFRDHIPYIVR